LAKQNFDLIISTAVIIDQEQELIDAKSCFASTLSRLRICGNPETPRTSEEVDKLILDFSLSALASAAS
jgi:hypothetical protein